MNDSTRARILQAAGQVFADHGYQGATIRDICHAADVNVAAVNYYFGDKRQLYVETVRQARELRMVQVPFPQRPPGVSAEVRLRDFIHVLARRMLGVDAEPWQTRLMMREILQPTSACEEMVEDYFRPHFERLLHILSELLPGETPAYRLRQIGYSIIGQCLYYRMAGKVVAMLTPEVEYQEHYSPEDIADHVTRITFAALGLAPPLSERASDIPVEGEAAQ
jgi:AcrR family transcriptional regulator